MNRTKGTMYVCFLGILLCLPAGSQAAPMGTATTYQGRLMDGDSPADGEYDFGPGSVGGNNWRGV